MAPVVFRRWGLTTTDDFGEIVFRLISAERLSQSDSDDPADFHEVFDLMQAAQRKLRLRHLGLLRARSER